MFRSVYFHFNNFLAKIFFFFRGYRGVYKRVVEIPEGLWGIISVIKILKFRGVGGGGGSLCEIPSVVGRGYFWNYTI